MKLQRQIDRLLAQRASEWHEILKDATDSQRAAFVAWLKQSPLHVQEYLETVYTDQVLKHVDQERLEDVDALIAQIAPSVVALDQEPLMPSRQSKREGTHWKRWRVGLGAAAGLALCVLGLPLIVKHFEAKQEYATALGEQRTIQLADSSIVTLNADSRIELHVNHAHRDIHLVRGEALFRVAHDSRRPFTVSTKTAVVTAVGTQFNVYERPNGTQVSVLEGRVKITPIANGSNGAKSGAGTPKIVPATEDLSAGQEAQVTPDGVIKRNAKPDVTKTVAWRERRLIFDNAPLEDMVYEFNRYNQSPRLLLDGVPPGSHHYNGIFDAADPDSLAALLSKEPDLIVERRDGEITIRKR
ncbi:MAG: FecR domain-containing protein [Proteobacteria bacterium]|nr:FecR domain-containing protein [Pseudomonadota bacterium]